MIEPDPEFNVRVGDKNVPVMLPAPSALNCADTAALRLAAKFIDPPEPLEVLNSTVFAVIEPVEMMVPTADREKSLPVEVDRFTPALSLNVTLPVVLALKLAAFV